MPKLKFTKEVIVDAAYDILKEEGFESISARKDCKKAELLHSTNLF